MADSLPTESTKADSTNLTIITDHIDIWTSAIKQKSSSGRGSSKKFSLHGVKKLRELILELAVRGKLVPQDEKDKPASIQLERIATEKAQLVQDKKIKKPKALPEISEDEKPFELPEGWEWYRLGSIATASTGYAFKSSQYIDNGTFVLRVTNINPDGSISKLDNKFIDPTIAEREFNKFLLCENDVLMVMVGGSLGKIGVVSKDVLPAILNQNMWKLSPLGGIPVPFFKHVLEFINKNQITITASTHGHLAQGDYLGKLVPIPPLEEQHRIVAKVHELMSLCDALEAQTEASITAHQTLVETLLNALLLPNTTQPLDAQAASGSKTANSLNSAASSENAQSPEPHFIDSPEPSLANSFAKDWQRVAEHFDTLFTTSASIDTLKQTILQLAVMGKLVEQDANDEPAAKLLERIAAEKVQLIADKKIKKQKPLPAITDEEKPFELPKGWEWIRFEDLVDIQGGITKGRKLAGRELMTVKYLSVANVQRSYLDLGYLKEVEIPIEEEEKYRVKARDLLITEGGDWDKVGRTAIWSDELPYIAHQNHVFKARIFLEEQSEVWLEKYLNGPYARDYFAGSSKQTTNLASINKTQLRGCLIAMPPKQEKDKIVAKVDELMALCDQLKARLSDAQTTQLHLTDAIIEQAV